MKVRFGKGDVIDTKNVVSNELTNNKPGFDKAILFALYDAIEKRSGADASQQIQDVTGMSRADVLSEIESMLNA